MRTGPMNFSRGNKPSICIVEDNKSMSMLLEGILSKEFQVKTCSCATEAIECVNGYKDLKAIILDISFRNSDEMDGIDLAKKLNYSGVEVPIVFLSGHDQEAIQGKLLGVNYEAYLKKPFNPVDLLDTLEDITEKVK